MATLSKAKELASYMGHDRENLYKHIKYQAEIIKDLVDDVDYDFVGIFTRKVQK
jgi:hypothetical protein